MREFFFFFFFFVKTQNELTRNLHLKTKGRVVTQKIFVTKYQTFKKWILLVSNFIIITSVSLTQKCNHFSIMLTLQFVDTPCFGEYYENSISFSFLNWKIQKKLKKKIPPSQCFQLFSIFYSFHIFYIWYSIFLAATVRVTYIKNRCS